MKTLFFLLAGLVPAFAQTTATLSVTADGTQPFTYSWKKDGVTIAGATSSSLVLSPLATTQSGLYAATVLNSAGSATAPANVIILGSSTAPAAGAPDLSKQFAELGLFTNFAPAPGTAPQFVIIPLKKVTDPGSHWDDTKSVYTVKTGEDGYYCVTITARISDQPPRNVSYGLTAGLDNTDTKTLWCVTPPDTPNYMRGGAQADIFGTYKAGDQIRCNIYVQADLTFIGFNVTVRRLY